MSDKNLWLENTKSIRLFMDAGLMSISNDVTVYQANSIAYIINLFSKIDIMNKFIRIEKYISKISSEITNTNM